MTELAPCPRCFTRSDIWTNDAAPQSGYVVFCKACSEDTDAKLEAYGATIEAALQYDEPQNNHDATALHGIIALRLGERATAQEAFAKSIAQADEILVKTPDYYSALDAKGLALSGLMICDLRLPESHVNRKS